MSIHVFETMGTMVSITFRRTAPDHATLDRVEAEFADWDARYSLYRPSSELSRIASGELALLDASPSLRSTYELATEWRASTRGAFSAHRPDGVLDLSGVVKATAMDAAGRILEAEGCSEWAINVGGDVLTARGGTDVQPWKIGIVDPANRGELLTAIAVADPRRACATSGVAERGDHIWTTGSTTEFAQATVVANDIVTADVLATAIISGGSETLDLVTAAFPIDVVTVAADGAMRMTPGTIRAMNLAAL